MAEVAVATALGLVQIIIPLLNKLNFPTEVKRDIESMRSWLSSIQAFMEDNHGRQGSRTHVDVDLIHKVGKIANDIEDVVDDFIFHSPPYTFHHYKFSRTIHTIGHNVYHHFPHHRVSEKISNIRKEIDDIKSQTAVFGNRGSNPGPSTNRVMFHTNFGNEIRSSSDLSPINKALLRSYLDLSSSLKCCFLYMSIFPEDHSVERGRLIRLWVAERFAMATEDHTAEEVAEDYLNELIQRNLIHVSNWDFDGRPRNCRVHNLALKFIIQKSKDENFASIFPKENTGHQIQTTRRLSVHDHCKPLPGDGEFASVRSMFLLRLPELNPTDFEKNLHKLKLIKVLDVQGAPLTEFPKEIARFTLMRYLCFRGTKIKSIDKSIKRLSYLETLDLKQTDVTELPEQISDLHNLCHLFVYKHNVSNYDSFDSVQGAKMRGRIETLTNLQSLSLVKIGENGRILRDLKALTRLRKLGVTGLRMKQGNDLCAAVGVMKGLKSLDITSAAKEEYIELEEMAQNPPKTLQRLHLKGCLRKIPTWIAELDYLVRIRLKWSKLSDSPLETLRRLPKLTEMQLVDCFIGEKLEFEASCFKKLKILVIEDLSNVKMIVIENGAMGEVKQISLRKCPDLMMLLGVGNLVKVEELTLHDMAEELVARLSINGEDRDWAKHVPLIHSYTLS